MSWEVRTMRSVTLYFNNTLYRKTMARFWPLWGLWGVFWMFLLPLYMLTRYFHVPQWVSTGPQDILLDAAQEVPQFLGISAFLTMGMGVLCAMAVFGYLYTSRSACWTHALPMRREALFTTQYLAGLSMLLLPQLAACLLGGLVELCLLPAACWSMALGRMATLALVQSGISLFFFSFAVFCAMFTGHILALPAFYMILNWLATGIWFLLDALMIEFYYGYSSAAGVKEAVVYLTPIAALNNAVNWVYGEERLSAPGTVAVYAVVGVLFFFAALLVYRRRHVETAGDVVAVALVRPLFKYGVSFCSGLAFGMFTAAFFDLATPPALTVLIMLWAVAGCFAAEMLLKKSFRVFQAWRGAVAMAGVLLVICLVCFLDLFGVVGRVPRAEQVTSIEFFVEMGYPDDSSRVLSTTVYSQEQIAKLIALHQAIVDNQKEDAGGYYDQDHDSTWVRLSYKLSGGGTLVRNYGAVRLYVEDLDTPGTATYAMEQLVQDKELVAAAYRFDSISENARLTSASLVRLEKQGDVEAEDSYEDTLSYESAIYLDDCRQELWDAVQRDFAEGNIGVRYLFDYSQERRANTCVADLIFEFSENRTEESNGRSERSTYTDNWEISVTLTPQAKYTLAVLDRTGLWEQGYVLRTQAGTVVR